LQIFFVATILLTAINCQEKNEKLDLNKIEKKILKLPINKRLAVWDSLIHISNDEQTKAKLFFNKANDLSSLEKDKEAVKYFEKALTIYQKIGIKNMEAKTFVNIGISQAFMDKKKKAVQNIFKGLNIANEINDDYIKSRAYNELAHIFFLNDNKDKAIEYLKKAGQLFKKLQDTAALSANYNNMAVIYKEQNEYKKAFDYTLKSFKLIDKNEPDKALYLINIYGNLAALSFLNNKNKEEALKYYSQALKIAKKELIEPENIYYNLGDMYETIKQYDSAKFYYQKAIAVKNDNYNGYSRLLSLNLKQHNNPEAINLLEKLDSLHELQIKAINKDVEKTIDDNLSMALQKKQLLQAKQLNNKNRIIFIFIIILFILGLLIAYQLNRLDRMRFKQERFLLEQKVLHMQMNPHFVFNVLSAIQNAIIENNSITSATYISKFAKLIRYNFDYINQKYISLDKELEMIRNYLDTQKFRYKDKFVYNINIDPEIKPDMTFMPPMILQPLIENTIEHGFKNIDYQGQLDIKIYKKNHLICFEITDNGTGYQPKTDTKEHALDIFYKRLKYLGKNIAESFKIEKLQQGTKVSFCLNKFSNKKVTKNSK